MFKKTKKTESSIETRKRTAVSIQKSKEKELNQTRKLTETCKENLKLELKIIKRSCENKQFNKTCTQRILPSKDFQLVRDVPAPRNFLPARELDKYKPTERTSNKVTCPSQNKENTVCNLSSTNKKVLDLLKSELTKKSSQSKPKTRRAWCLAQE